MSVTPGTESVVEALQTALAAEHAAVHVFGVLGGRTSQSGSPALFAAVSAAHEAHRARRDRLTAGLTDLDASPVAAEAAYAVPGRLETDQQIARTALMTEQSCAVTYAWLVAQASEDWRRWAITALIETAVRELAFGGEPEPFPGADDLA